MTVALGTNIANPISTALSQWPGFDTMGKLANYGILGVTDPDAVIKALFASGEQGAWYDPSDLTTMFQNSAGTTPVTADGQPVGLIRDKSGRGNHASQANAAARPLYKTSGGLHWLQFDGVDDALSTAAIDFTATDKMSVFIGYSASSGGLFSLGNIVLPGTMRAYYSTGTSSTFQANGGTTFLGSVAVYSGKAVISNGIDFAASNQMPVLRSNGLDNNPNVSGMGAGPFSNAALRFGYEGYATYFLGDIYSLIVLGRLSSTQEITDTETWVAAKTGISL